MRIPSGVTDQYIYFVAVDSTDLKTRETGLSSFTVYRSRNGAAAAAMTTPTVNETDTTNMPGVYELLLDEDMTIGSGNDSEEMVFHITATGMAPVTRAIELYRPKITAGNTLGVESDGDLTKVNTLDGHTAQTGDNYARLGAPAGASVSADIAAIEAQTDDIGAAGAGLTAIPWNSAWDAEVQSECTDALNAYDPPTKVELDSGLAALNDLSAAEVNTEVDTALADIHLDHLLAVDYDPASKPGTATALLNELVENDTGVSRFTANALEEAPTGGSAPTAAAIADAVWDEATAGHTTGGTFGEQVKTDIDAILVDTNELQSDDIPGTLTTLDGKIDTIDGIVDTILVDTGTTLDGKINTIDTNVDAILADTGTDGVVISTATAQAIADELLKRDFSAVSGESARSALNALRFLRNKWSISGTTLTVTEEDDSTAAWTATVTTDAAADPVTANDPA